MEGWTRMDGWKDGWIMNEWKNGKWMDKWMECTADHNLRCNFMPQVSPQRGRISNGIQ